MKSLLLLFLFIVVSCSSRTKVNNPFYYEVTKGDQTLHVLGTMHVRFDFDDFHPKFKKDLYHVEKVCLEVDEKLMAEYAKQTKDDYLRYMQRTFIKSYPLRKKLSATAWKNLRFTLEVEEVQKILYAWNITVKPFEVDPNLAREIIRDLIKRNQNYAFPSIVFERSKNHEMRWMYFDSEKQLDLIILKDARRRKIPVMALDEISTFDQLNTDENLQKRALDELEFLYGGDTINVKSYHEMKSAYQSGNEARMVELLEPANKIEVALIKRNKLWAAKLKQLNEKRVFVAVGAGHLLGKDNLLELLEKEGYSVKKIILKEASN